MPAPFLPTAAAGASADRPAPGAWWAVGVFSLAAILSYTDRLILNLLVDPIRAELAISDTQISLLQGAAFAVLYAVAGIPLGRLADRVRRRDVLVAGATIWSLATVACAFAPNFGTLFAARIFVGIGEAALAPAAISIIADLFPPSRRGMAIGTFLMGMVIGSGTAFVFGGALLSAAQGGSFAGIPVLGSLPPWRIVMVLAGMPGLVIVALLLTIAEPPRRNVSAVPPFGAAIRHFITDRKVLLPLYLGLAIIEIGNYGTMGWAPALLSRRYGWAPADTGAVIGSINIAAGIFGALLGGALADRMQRIGGARAQMLVVVIAAGVALPSALLLFLDSDAAVIVALSLWTLAGTIAGAVAITVLQSLIPDQLRGMGTSLVAFFNTLLGLGLGPTLVALNSEHVYRDPTALHLSIATVLFPVGIITCLLFRRAQIAQRVPA